MRVKNGFESIEFRVGLGPVDPYFSYDIYIYIYIYKENNMYLPFGKLCNKLLDVKCIIFNSLLI